MEEPRTEKQLTDEPNLINLDDSCGVLINFLDADGTVRNKWNGDIALSLAEIDHVDADQSL